MTSTVRLLYSYYEYVNEDLSDPRTKNWFLSGIWSCIALLGAYVYFVQVLGPAFMAKRKPYNLRKILVVYNVAQILLNGFLAYQAVNLGWFWKFKFICEPIDFTNTPEAVKIASMVWVFYMVKVFDLMDTIFFILRKKENQITFLHVYHHAGMVLAGMAGVRYLPGGHGTFIGLINSAVHVVMYTYYLLTSLKYDRPWWKKHITQLQLLQFYTVLIHFMIGILTKDCGFPKWALVVFLPQNFFMMVLFTDFYYKTYLRKKPDVVNTNGVSNATESTQNNELPNGKSKTH